jgi:Putative bacterial sensory transduction regulator
MDEASALERVQAFLEEIFEPPVEMNDQQVFHFDRGSARVLVMVVTGEDGVPAARVASPVIMDVEKTAELLDTLNLMNHGMEFARAYWVNGTVWAAIDLLAETLDRQELERAMSVVGEWADSVDEAMVQRFGGVMPNAPQAPSPVEAWVATTPFSR